MGKKKIRKSISPDESRRIFGGLQSDEFRIFSSPISVERVMDAFRKEDKTTENIADRLPELSEEQKRNVQIFLIDINMRLGWNEAVPIAVRYLVATLKITEQEARLVYRIVSAHILTDGL